MVVFLIAARSCHFLQKIQITIVGKKIIQKSFVSGRKKFFQKERFCVQGEKISFKKRFSFLKKNLVSKRKFQNKI